MKIEMPNAPHHAVSDTVEAQRLMQADNGTSWRKFGPYLSDRQWGTVREDYSASGDAWTYLPHDHARSRAYRWGEDAIAGFSDDQLAICLGLALWNGADPILKERFYGLTNAEGNHGEDVKELYYYLDATPTHSYNRMLYKYPQAAYPYEELRRVNAQRSLTEREYEIYDTGVFDDGRYFDATVEYAKASPDDILMKVTIDNRGAAPATLHVLPQIWSRNTWTWQTGIAKPVIAATGDRTLKIEHRDLPAMQVECDGTPTLLFTENETNTKRLYGVGDGHFKDGINDYVVGGQTDAVNHLRVGTKAAAHHVIEVPAHGRAVVRLRLRRADATSLAFADFDAVLAERRAECDAFYDAVQADMTNADARLVQRQAFAGMLWSKQYYGFDIREWLKGDPTEPVPPGERLNGRDVDWTHLQSADIFSMPDAWEYPWFAAWDLAFHSVTFALIDPAFAKAQLVLLMQSRFLHPNGQLPAYEWNFSDTNPPVQALAALMIYDIDKDRGGTGDTIFLRRVFHKLLLNFTWWVNKEDASDRNIFEGGFLGLDNISLFDRSGQLPEGGHLDQADGTAWAAVFCLNMLRMAIEIALEDHVYEDMAIKFFEHFLLIAGAVHRRIGGEDSTGLWDDADGFYYDVLEIPGEPAVPLRVRSMVGLIPLFAVELLSGPVLEKLPDFHARLRWLFANRPELAELVSRWNDKNSADYSLLALMRKQRLNRVLTRMLDETEFLSDYGIRSVSKVHLEHPATVTLQGEVHTVAYTPGEGTTRLYGGNSNWRGPIWMPVNFIIVAALQRFHTFYGDDFSLACPTGSGNMMTLDEISNELSRRLTRLFLRDGDGRRAIYDGSELLQTDPHFRDHILFYEHFHGDTGRGLGASHQTGWTGLVAVLLHPPREIDPDLGERATGPRA